MIQAVIFDWAGTTVDYGCFAPLAAFMESFREKGVEVTVEEARIPMGLPKRDHVAAMCRMERIALEWERVHGHRPTEEEIDEIYEAFMPRLFGVLTEYSRPIPGVVEVVERLRANGIRIGSTTGYMSDMMRVVAPEAERHGYKPDVMVTPDEVAAGRPLPWMCYRNAMLLDVYPMRHIVKVGDTTSDMKEGVNAGVWTVGVIEGSSELGMTEEEVRACPEDVLEEKCRAVEERFRAAGADYVIRTMNELEHVIETINLRMGEKEGVR